MRRITLLSILLYGFILLALLTLNSTLLVLVIPFLLYIAVAVLIKPDQLEIRVKRTISPERTPPGVPVQVSLAVQNQGTDIDEALLEDMLPAGLEILEGDSKVLSRLPKGSTVEIQYTVQGKRGLYYFPGVTITASETFGLVRHKTDVSTPGKLFIVPSVPQLKRVSIRPRQTRVYSGVVPARQGGTGIDFYGVRDYQPGDPLRSINWHATARNPSEDELLYVNEFEQERVVDVTLVLDARARSQVVTGHGGLYEHIISAAAALAQALLREGNRVGLLIYGRSLERTYPGYGKIQLERILQALVRSQPGDSMIFESLDNLPTQMLPARSQVILISPLQPDDHQILANLRARGYQVMVICPDPVEFQQQGLSESPNMELARRLAYIERDLLHRKLRRAGVYLVPWKVSIPFDHAMQRALSRPPSIR
jgi:uncharacterized protein (DUF58 family)